MRQVCVLLVLAGCSAAPEGPPKDAALGRFGRAGDIAMDQEKPDQAAEQYRLALGRARERDDEAAIADAGFNLATAELRENHPEAAARTAAEIRAELARRGSRDAGLDLVTATALFRMGRVGEADRWAAGLVGSVAVADRAWFLRGLIADGRGDRAGLVAAEGAMSTGGDAGDRAELRARLSRDSGLALGAADLRRTALDYRGMARALALAAGYARDGSRAADLYLRAGRSAAAQGDSEQARRWLVAGRREAREAGLLREFEAAIGALK